MSSDALRRFASKYYTTLKYIVPANVVATNLYNPSNFTSPTFKDQTCSSRIFSKGMDGLVNIYLNTVLGLGLGIIYPIGIPLEIGHVVEEQSNRRLC